MNRQSIDMNKKSKSSYASVNGLKLYYEIHGSGRPLVLLHGGLSTIETSFSKVLPAFAQTRQVIAIEQQAHDHSADIDRPLTDEQMAEDTAALLHQLSIETADFFSYSLGSEIALEIAMRHPELVRKLVLASPAYRRDGQTGIHQLLRIEEGTDMPQMIEMDKNVTLPDQLQHEVGPV